MQQAVVVLALAQDNTGEAQVELKCVAAIIQLLAVLVVLEAA
jgi:hypothetical protein